MPSLLFPAMFDGGRDDAGWRATRRRALGLAGGGVLALLTRGSRALAAPTALIKNFRLAAPGPPCAGYTSSLAALSGATRRRATVHFALIRRAEVSFGVLQTVRGPASEFPVAGAQSTLTARKTTLGPGAHTLQWEPPSTLPARTYIVRLTADHADGESETAHGVVRIVGVDAAFAERSAMPGDPVTLVVNTDARTVSVQMVHSGPEPNPTYANNVFPGVPVGPPTQPLDWPATGAP